MIIQDGRALPQIARNIANLLAHPRNLMARSDKKNSHAPGRLFFCRKVAAGK
jgi:hypothetical protein